MHALTANVTADRFAVGCRTSIGGYGWQKNSRLRARRAALVRGLSMRDCLGMGIAFIAPLYSIWFIEQVGLGLYPKANVPLAILISVVDCGLGSSGRLGHPRQHDAAKRRRVRLQLAHHSSGDRHGRELRHDRRRLLLGDLQRLHVRLALLGDARASTWAGRVSPTSWAPMPEAFTLSVVAMLGGLLLVIFGMNVFHKLAWIAIAVMCGRRRRSWTSRLPSRPRPTSSATGTRRPRSIGSLTYDAFLAAAGTAAGACDADKLDMVGHLRHHRRRLHDLRLDIRPQLHRRRSEAS